jgi:hypothetical protein
MYMYKPTEMDIVILFYACSEAAFKITKMWKIYFLKKGSLNSHKYD